MAGPLRLGILGTGAIARRHAGAIAAHPDQVRITAVCDTDASAAGRFAATIGQVHQYGELDQLIDSGQVDAVIVATPHFLHCQQALRLVQARLPTLVEKPLVTTLADLRALRDAAAATGPLVVAGQMQRFDKVNVTARRWIEQDESRFGQMTSFALRSWQDITEYVAAIGGSHWLLDGERAGGGVVVSLAVHQIDLLRYLSGTDYAQVIAMGAFDKPFHTGAESTAVVLITMANGAVGTLHSAYLAPRGFQSESMTLFGAHGGFTKDFRAQGYHGPLLYSPAHDDQRVNFSDPERVASLGLAPGLGDNPFENQILHFARAVRGEAQPLNTVEDNFNTIACIDAINQALLTPGVAVDVPTN
jgi:predicted dehydrogenase